ncbi:MAG: DNA-binding protein WhiA [Clostridiaceae bacterium]|nr:DNA-binding protein WhiA [Clostridiaceae bacterium]
MSFSLDVKREMSRIEVTEACCKKSELAGILRAGLTMRNTPDRFRLLFSTENAPLSRRVFILAKEIYGLDPGVSGRRTRRFRNRSIYQLNFSGLINDRQELLNDIGLSISPDSGEMRYMNYRVRKRCCKRAYLRGGFLAAGSISDPDKSYHLEVSFRSQLQADEYIQYLNDFGLQPRSIQRKGYYLAYLKEGQEIVDFLNVTGAHKALMNLENIRIMKEMRNQVNRIVNCETANLSKTVDASLRQTESIRFIQEHAGLDSLPDALREIALLRLENPGVSLAELGRMMEPPLSKSGVNHRLRKIERIALSMGFNTGS